MTIFGWFGRLGVTFSLLALPFAATAEQAAKSGKAGKAAVAKKSDKAEPVQPTEPAQPDQPAEPTKTTSEGQSDYVIGDGDGLQVSVWGVPELSVGVAVRPDGKITLPAIGDVTASGYTPMKLAEKLTERLKEVVKAPIVTVTVGGITNNKVYVIGGGVPPGINVLAGRTTLMKFMARFGSYKGADLTRAYIMRDGRKLDVNFYDLLIKGELSGDLLLKPEDIIYVPDNEFNKIYVMGAVNTPKLSYHREGYKILDAILEAGGMTKFARENDVQILRKGSAPLTVKVKDLMKEGDLTQNIYLMPGDFIIVKEGIF